jgi:hypothetical protein
MHCSWGGQDFNVEFRRYAVGSILIAKPERSKFTLQNKTEGKF